MEAMGIGRGKDRSRSKKARRAHRALQGMVWIALAALGWWGGWGEGEGMLWVRAQAQATVAVEKVSIPKGKTGTVSLSVQGVPAPGLQDFQGKLLYDPAVIWVQDVTGLNGYSIFAFQIDNNAGEARFIGAKVSGNLLTQGKFLQFKVRAVGDVGAKTTLEVSFVSLNTPEGDFPFSVVTGQVAVTAPQELKADFTFSPERPQVGQVVQFTDRSRGGGTLTSWEWDFGDGSTSTEQNPKHTYTQAGTYTVKLTVQDDTGASATASKTITVVEEGQAPAEVTVYVFPNPARTRATFVYSLPSDAQSATLWVFDLRGRLVLRRELEVEASRFSWNLRDGRNRPVPPGPYYFRVAAATDRGVRLSEVGRMLILR